jgi:hypothetical protein
MRINGLILASVMVSPHQLVCAHFGQDWGRHACMITNLPAVHVADHLLQRHDDLDGDISDEHHG